MTLCCKPSTGTNGWEKGVVTSKTEEGWGSISVSSAPSLPDALLFGPAKHSDKHFIFPPFLPSYVHVKSKDELLSYVWCRPHGWLCANVPHPCAFVFSSFQQDELRVRLAVMAWRMQSTRSRHNSESPLSKCTGFGLRHVAVLFCWDGHVLRPSQYSCLCPAN